MTTAFTFNPAEYRTTPSDAPNRFVRMFQAVAERLSETRRMDRAYKELAAMSDHEFDDIGIRRSDIRAVIAGRLRR